MRSARGFKGRYFSLIAIATLSGEIYQRRVESSIRVSFCHLLKRDKEQKIDESPPDILDSIYTLVSTKLANKACHCNYIFGRRFLRFWYLYKFFFTPPNRYFKTKTGTSPPL